MITISDVTEGICVNEDRVGWCEGENWVRYVEGGLDLSCYGELLQTNII